MSPVWDSLNIINALAYSRFRSDHACSDPKLDLEEFIRVLFI